MQSTRLALGLVCALVLAVLALPAARTQEPDTTPETKKLLFLTHAGLYKHASLGPAEEAVIEWGRSGGFDVTTLEGYKQSADQLDLSRISAAYLAEFDGVMFMTNGNLPLDPTQRSALIDFVRNGGGFIGAHCASLTLYDHPEFGEMLGGYFRRAGRQNTEVILKVEDREHPSTRMLGASWNLADEFYLFGTAAWTEDRPEQNVDVLFGNRIPVGFSRDRVRVLLSIDSERSNLEGFREMEAGGDYPQAWCRSFGNGRSFYTSLGHRPELWSGDPVFRKHITGGIRWALGLEAGDATPRGQLSEVDNPLQEASMRYIRYSVEGKVSYGKVSSGTGDGETVHELDGGLFDSPRATGVTHSLSDVRLLAPVEPSKVIAVGLNYKSHIGGRAAAEYPGLFAKFPSSIIAHEQEIVIPPDATNMHYEGEMVVVIGKRAKNISVEEAPGVIFGVTIGNDVSERRWQSGDLQWFRAKGADTFGPLGPHIVTGLDYGDLLLETRLNGETVQSQRTADLIFDVPTCVSYISQYVTLLPGDVIYTGTPGTTRAFEAGDVIEVELEGVGVLRNRAVAADSRN